jgi:hypothetical protein
MALWALALLAWCLGPAAAHAQAAVNLASLQVSIWPEYDQPTALVILDGQLDPAVALPASLAIRIPAAAGAPHAVAVTGTNEQLLSANYTTRLEGDDIIIMFQTPSPGFRVEYYDPTLTVAGEARTFVFDWQTDYAIAAAMARVQQPASARDLAGEPALTPLGTGQDGLEYYAANWGPRAPGDRLSLRLTYAKSGPALTNPGQGAAPVPQTVTPQPANNSRPWLIGGTALGLALAGAGLYAYARDRQRARASARPRHRRATTMSRPANAGAGATPVPTGPAGFCTQCGQPRVAGDRFCRNCGARLVTS